MMSLFHQQSLGIDEKQQMWMVKCVEELKDNFYLEIVKEFPEQNYNMVCVFCIGDGLLTKKNPDKVDWMKKESIIEKEGEMRIEFQLNDLSMIREYGKELRKDFIILWNIFNPLFFLALYLSLPLPLLDKQICFWQFSTKT